MNKRDELIQQRLSDIRSKIISIEYEVELNKKLILAMEAVLDELKEETEREDFKQRIQEVKVNISELESDLAWKRTEASLIRNS